MTLILQELMVDREFKELLDHRALLDLLVPQAPLASQDYKDRQDLEESVEVKVCQDLQELLGLRGLLDLLESNCHKAKLDSLAL